MLDDMFKKLTEAESRYEEALNDYKNAPRGNNLIDRHIVITLQDAEENYKDVLVHYIGVLAALLREVTTTPDHL